MKELSLLREIDLAITDNVTTVNLFHSVLFLLHFNHGEISSPFPTVATTAELPWKSLCEADT